MGGVLHPDTDTPISAKKRSQLDKYLQAKPGAMDALTAALGIYRQSEEPEPGRAAFTGGARSMAGELPGAQSPQAIRRIREMIEADARARRGEFSKREDVQLFKAAFKEHGFAAFGAADDLQAPEGSILAERTGGTSGIGSNLVDAYNLRATDPGKAREKAVEALTIFASLFPKDFRKLFPAKAKGKDPKIGTSRQTKSGEGVDPALEAVGAAIQAIFGDLYTQSVPRRDAQAKLDRKLDMEARSETGEDAPPPGLIAEQTAKRQREAEAFAMAQRGLSRARIPQELAPEPIKMLDLGPERISVSDRAAHDPVFAEAQAKELRDRESTKRKLSQKTNPIKILDFGPSSLFPRRAAGGPIKKGGLLGRLAARGVPLPEGAYVVGEEGPEVFVPKADGHIIDNKAQNIPEWLRRSKSGEGRGKDLTGHMRADGGPVKAGASIESLKKAIAANPDGPIAEALRSAIKFLEGQVEAAAPAAPSSAPVIQSPFAAGAKKVSKPKAAVPKAEAKPRGAIEVSSVDERDFGTPPEEPAKPKAVARPKAAAKPKAPAKPKAAPVIRGAVEVSSTDERDFGEPPPTPPKAAPKPKVQVPGLPPGHTFTPGADPKPKAAPAPVAAAPKAAPAPKTPAPVAAGSGGIVRVFVTNWPASLTRGSIPAATSRPATAAAAGPVSALPGLLNAAQAASAPAKAAKGAAGAATPKVSKGGGLTPLEQAQLEAKTQDLITAKRLDQKKIAADISASIREAPTRGLQTATGEIAAINLGGLRGVIERRRLAEEATVRSTAALNLFAKAQAKVEQTTIKLAKAQDPKQIAELTKLLHGQEQAASFLDKRYTHLAGEAQKLSENVITTSDKLKVFGANTLGIIGGTLLFGGALTAAQAAVGGLGQLIGPVIERMTGFANKSAEVTSALAQQTDATGGAAESAIAAAAAQANLSARAAATISPLLEQRAATESGNKNLQEAIDLLHTYEEARRRGGDQGLFGTTGGLFGTILGGTASTQELIKKELGGGDTRGETGLPEAPFFGSGQIFGPSGQTKNRGLLGGVVEEFDILQERIRFFNEQIKKGGENVRFMSGATEEAATQFAAAADKANLTEIGDIAQGPNRVILVDESGRPVLDPERIKSATEAVNVGFQTPDAEQLIKPLVERIIPNQLAAFEAEANFQLQKIIPAGRSLDFLASPPTPFGAGFTQVQQGPNGAVPFGNTPISGIEGVPSVDTNATQSFNTYRTVAQSAIDAVIAKAREGRAALLDLGVPPQLIAELETLGNQAQGIELGVANQRAAFEATQYNHQLFILNRNLADARALLGQNVGAQGRLGALQRENFELGKKQHALQIQAQELQLNLTQRQINFQRAIAGFVAPGTTPEERAARIEQAKIEADFAQKQLDIQKQLLGLGKKQFIVGVQIFDESAKRQVQDLQFALAELKQARALQLDTTAAQQALAAIRARQAQINSEIGVAIEKSTKKASLAINTALDIANKSGEAFSKILVQTATAWNVFVNQGARAVISLLTGASGGPQGGGGGGKPPMLLASGIVGDTLGPTNITVGEAGKEKVAVVKNPKNVSLQSLAGVAPSGGSGVMVIVDVHDNNVEKDTLDALVAKVSAAVETSLNRKTSLFGLRRA
jgi:hypothetical protein